MYDWIEIKLPEPEVKDTLWMVYDYLWVQTDRGLYLSRDQGETFKKVSTIKFVFTNIWQLIRKWLRK